MGLLDSVLGQALGGAGQQPGQDGAAGGLGNLAGELGGLLNGSGGVGGLVDKFQQAGLGDVVGSWVGTGQNAPVSGEQLNNVLGSDVISGLAQKLGINVQALLPMLASVLPMLVDRLTPNGQLPAPGQEAAPGQDGSPDLGALLGGLLPKQ